MDIDEENLILQAQRGDVIAFERLVQTYNRQVLTIALAHMQNEEDAKDIHQEVFLRVYRALPKFRMESKFSTWLHRIATNVCLTHRSLRRKHTHASIDEGIEGQTLSETLADKSRTDEQTMSSQIDDRVRSAMKSLSPQQRLVFSLRHYEGYKLKEIASMMNCAEGTVKKYLFTATERLRDQLREVF